MVMKAALLFVECVNLGTSLNVDLVFAEACRQILRTCMFFRLLCH